MGTVMKKIIANTIFMLDSLLKASKREKDVWSIPMEVFMRASFIENFPMELEISNTPTRTSISDNSSREKNMEKATISSAKELSSVVDGKTIKS